MLEKTKKALLANTKKAKQITTVIDTDGRHGSSPKK